MKKIVFSLMVVAVLGISAGVVAQDNTTKECCKEKKEKCEKKDAKDAEKTGKACCADKKSSGCTAEKNAKSTTKKEKENCAVKKDAIAKNKSCGKKS
ncbi:MAG: hypothetical protein LBP72_05660 [Dysgonamonadaceae bacterium]|jgi:hypothetical protein|nr:hypothetical protein [Dysgonamonadaceae bacterium]